MSEASYKDLISILIVVYSSPAVLLIVIFTFSDPFPAVIVPETLPFIFVIESDLVEKPELTLASYQFVIESELSELCRERFVLDEEIICDPG